MYDCEESRFQRQLTDGDGRGSVVLASIFLDQAPRQRVRCAQESAVACPSEHPNRHSANRLPQVATAIKARFSLETSVSCLRSGFRRAVCGESVPACIYRVLRAQGVLGALAPLTYTVITVITLHDIIVRT